MMMMMKISLTQANTVMIQQWISLKSEKLNNEN